MPGSILLLTSLMPLIGVLVISIPFLLGIDMGRKACGIISAITLLSSTALLLYAAHHVVRTGAPIREFYHIPVLTFRGGLHLFADGLSLPLALLAVSLSALSALYSISYMSRVEVIHLREIRESVYYSVAYKEALAWPEYVPRRKSPFEVPSIEAYYICLLLFAVSMLGTVLVTNLVHFIIFYELVTIPTALLVYVWGSGPCRLISIKYFIYMLIGGILVLTGVAWIYAETRCLDILGLHFALADLHLSSLIPISVLLFTGFGIKAAIFPLHTWLPDFHAEAPVPIHALLSGVLIKCGVYGIMRVAYPCLIHLMMDIKPILLAIALLTMIWGALMAVMQRQIKRILAYSSINQIGYIMLGIASGNPLGICGALLHVVTHGISKDMLLLCAGSVIHSAHSRNVDELGGLAGRMPITSSCMLLGGLSIAGVPPLAGFASEWMIFLGVVEAGYLPVALIGMLSTALTMGYYLWAVRRMFFQELRHGLEEVRESPPTMIIPILVDAALIILIGVYPQIVLQLIHPYAQAVGGV